MTDFAQRVEEKRLQEAVQDRSRSVAEAERRKTFHPKGYEPGVEVKGDGGFITTSREEPAEPTTNEWRELLEIWGLDPEVYEVDPYFSPEFRAWDNNLGRHPETGEENVRRFYYYKAKIRLKSKWNGLNVDEMLVGISKFKRPKKALTTFENPVGMVIPLSDWQIGKGDGDGVEGTLVRVLEALQMALDYYKELVKLGVQIECVYLIGMGDMIEQCFSGETEIVTQEGIQRLDKLAVEGHTVVKTDFGKWVEAEIKSFGVQKLMKVELSRMGAKKTVYATPGHRWFKLANPSANHGKVEFTTAELAPGDYLTSTFGRGPQAMSPFGVARGYVYGDGHRESRHLRSSGCAVNVHRKDWDGILPYFEGCRRSTVRQHAPGEFGANVSPTEDSDFVKVTDCPSYFKQVPDLHESPSYLMGWLAGYFAADGSVSKTVSISSADRSSLEFVADVCARVGIGTQPITSRSRVGIRGIESDLHQITLLKSTIPEWFFVHERHRENFLKITSTTEGYVAQRNRGICWRVEGVEMTDREEEVFCAVVPDTESFVLANDILTGNCRGNYPGQAFTTELNRREQIRLARRLLKEWVVEFSKVAPHVVFGGVAGNHGENRNESNKAYTTPGDNDDVAVFEMVAEVLMENPEAFGHVNFLIPEERLSVVLDICGVRVGFTHGHLSSRGADPQAKQKNWLKDMAFSQQPIGDAKLIVTGHYHHTQVVDHGPKTWIQCPAMDGGCYSADTEVLTKRGWLTHDLLTLEDQVACFDLDTETTRWDAPSKIHEYDHEGVMHHWKGRSLDFLVTPNHRMVTKTRYKQDEPWEFVESQDVDSNVWNRIPWAAPFENDTPDLSTLSLYGEEPVQDLDAFLYLIGMYVSEGNLTNGHVVISQNEGEVADKIDKALASLGWEFTKHTTERPSGLHHRWDFGVKKNPHLCAWLAGNCFIYSKHKRLPPREFLDQLSLRQKGVLYGSLMDGDGHWDSGTYHTTSVVLADQVQALAIELGMKASRGVAHRELPWSDKYMVFTNTNEEFAIRSERHLTEVDYSGKVYCLTVPTGAYITRHNGRAGICGNSQWWENATGSRSTAGTLAFCVGEQYPIGFDRFRILGFETPPAKL